MKNILSSISLFFIALLVFCTSVWAHTDVSVSQALDMVNTNPQLIVVDVREEGSEYCGPLGHIPGALNYPWSSGVLEDRYDELPIDGEILVVCHSGGRSNSAANFLDAQGFTSIYDMNGGMSSWTGETVGCVDSDNDGLNDDLDNCPDDNNPDQEDVDCDDIGDVCDPLIDCTEGVDCDNDCDGVYNQDDTCVDLPNPGQEDTLPPGGNGCGDTCECEGNFDGDLDCDGTDASDFKTDFGRSMFNSPCESGNTCNGDVDCDGDVDGTDAQVFKQDFGRSQFSNPCPPCSTVPWCVYP